MEIVLIVFLVVGLALMFRLFAGSLDHNRVEDYIASRGGRVLEKHWNPFGRGWFGEKDSRIYSVRYQDREGNVHEATCKTSLFSGVYFTEDRIVGTGERAVAGRQIGDLEEENRRLREELQKLKRESG